MNNLWYSQFGEDKKLVELLGDKSTGFYIDIGAWWSDIDSVTKHFYDKGWNGINVEPIDVYYEDLERNRERDINIKKAISIEDGESDIFYIHDTGRSTLISKFAEVNVDNLTIEKIIVYTITLSKLCDLYVPEGTIIDFLKIDVEGNEENVIKSGNWVKYRPTIICIESVEPITQIPSHHSWENYLIDNNYVFIYFDGINRYYKDSLINKQET